jgi:hypothetical protein
MQKQITLVPVTGTPHHGCLPDGTGIPVLHAAEPHESVKGQSRRLSDIRCRSGSSSRPDIRRTVRHVAKGQWRLRPGSPSLMIARRGRGALLHNLMSVGSSMILSEQMARPRATTRALTAVKN